MEKPFLKKKIDAIQTFFQGPVFMSCGLQHVSEEAKKETYPYQNENYILTADAILDNRDTLKDSFTMVSPLSHQGIDGSMLFDCVSENLDKALDEMLGAFVFALYDKNKEILTLANDAVGTRSVYYMVIGDRIYFSSLLGSLIPFLPNKKRNDQWFFNFYAQDSLVFVNEFRETPYEGIYRLEPGEVLQFSAAGLTRRAYWDPLKNRKELKLPSHEAYAEQVRQVFGDAVRRLIRGDRDAAILLSGGLDSNAVAAFAAPYLKTLNRNLRSFTSVPDAEHPMPIEQTYYVPDERSYVELMAKIHKNIIPSWIGCNHFDYLEECRKAMGILEIPFKTIPNMPWMKKAYEEAAKAGCSCLLSGQYGNITISVGNYENLFETLLRSGRLLTLDQQIKFYGKVYHRRRRWTYRVLLKSLIPKSSMLCAKKDLNPRFYNKDKAQLRRLSGKKHILPSSIQRLRPYMYDKIALRQVGETELKVSLETGVIPRDPTRDKKLIEFIMSLPVEELCFNGMDRRLVREDMNGFVPEEIAKDIFHRGQQGVGGDELLKQCWPQIKEELRKEYETGHAKDFLNIPYLLQQLDNEEVLQEEDTAKIVRMIYCGLCSEYLGSHYGT